ncbi:MAG: hypothetical protein QOK31_1669 [Solirubrobacteraceae bacterium]|jgi:hypothetical protein|nr:hypothetical protein [Solirubrobacteraceae bacterium]
MADGGVVHIPWYATVFRGDKFEAAVAEIAPVALRYGALDYEVQRSKEDRYKFLQTATFERKLDFTAYWEGPEFIEFRATYTSWFQVPVVYQWHARVTRGALASEHPAPLGAE